MQFSMFVMTVPETRAWDGQQVDIEEMTGQWLGATVASSSSNGELLVRKTLFRDPTSLTLGSIFIRPCHTAAILSAGDQTSFVLPRQASQWKPWGLRLGVVKQSFFGLPGKYGRRVTRANRIEARVLDTFCPFGSPIGA